MIKILDALNAQIIATGKHKQITHDYLKLKTDEERIIYTFNVMLEYNIVPQSCNDEKNAQQSEKLREQGNKMFVSTPLKSRTCVEAFKLYTKSIANAPCPSEQLALAYANRSAVLMKMHLYEDCVKDIDKALSLPYPDNFRAKLYVRKVECLVTLKNPIVQETINEAQLWLEKLSLDDINRKKLSEKLESTKLSSLQQLGNQSNARPQTKPRLPKLKFRNPEAPCASNAVAIKYNERYGRHIVATRDLHPGDTIVVEKPYSLILSIRNMQTHCSNCLEVCWSSIPCDYCTYAMYCSEACKAKDWEMYHDIECRVFPTLIKMEFVNLDLFSLRLAIKAVRESKSMEKLREEIEEVDRWSDPRTRGFSRKGIFESDKYRSVLSLVTNTEKRSAQDLFRRSLDSCYILYLAATETALFGKPLEKDLFALANNADVTLVGGLIMRHQQMIPSNVHSFSENCGLDAVERGNAAMPFCSLINHGCYPNISRLSTSDRIIVIVTCPIKKGEQVLDNYSQHYAITPKDARQKELLKQYHFTCNCVACVEDWPLFYNVKSYKNLVKNMGDLNKISHALRKFNAYVDLATEGNVADKPHIVKDLLNMIQVLHDCVPMPCDEMNNVVETLKHVYDLSGNRFEIPEL